MDHVASFDGTPIAYTDAGTGPAVLLLHGFAADHTANWAAPGVIDALVGSGRRVIATDARGHGQSGKPHDPDAYAGATMPRDAQAVLDHLGVEEVDVVGYSMGSMVSARLVADEPRARSLILGGVGGTLTPPASPPSGGLADALLADDPTTIGNPVTRPSGRSPTAPAPIARRWPPSTGRRRCALPSRSNASPCRPSCSSATVTGSSAHRPSSPPDSPTADS